MQSPPPARRSELRPAQRQQLVAFIERDYALTQEVASSAHSAVVASRSVGFTLVAALLGVGLTQKSWPLLLLATFSASAIYVIDAFYTWRASERDSYARELEGVLAAHFDVVRRAPHNQRELARLDRRLAAVRIGTTSQIRTFKVRDVWFIQPAPLKFLYLVLLVFALGACLYFAFFDKDEGTHRGPPPPRSVLIADVNSSSPLLTPAPRWAWIDD